MSYWHELEREYKELKEQNAALYEETDLQRQSIQDLSAQVVKMQTVINAVRAKHELVCMLCYNKKDCNICILGSIMQALADLEGGTPCE